MANTKDQNAKDSSAEVFVTVIGGGGAGGAANGGAAGGGGGAGGVIKDVSLPLKPGSYEVKVGRGGANGSDGDTSSFNGVLVAHGGAGGKGGTVIVPERGAGKIDWQKWSVIIAVVGVLVPIGLWALSRSGT